MKRISPLISLAALPLLALVLGAGCNDDGGTCVVGTPEQPWACIETTSQVRTSDAKTSCTMNGGMWQESSCSVEGAVGQCEDLAGSISVFYPEYLVAFSFTSADMRETCEEQSGVYTEF